MYERIVVATDTTRPATAVTIASALAADVGALELSPSRRRAHRSTSTASHCNESPSSTVGFPPRRHRVAGPRRRGRVVRHLARRRAALLVIGSSGHHPLTRADGGPVTRQLLADSPDPILVVGPNVGSRFHAHPGKLVLAVDRPDPVPATLDAVERWVHTFGSGRTWTSPSSASPTTAGADRAISRWVDVLHQRDLPVSPQILQGPVIECVDGFATGVRNAVVVTTSRRDSDGRRHLHSTTRDLSTAAATPCSWSPTTCTPDPARGTSRQHVPRSHRPHPLATLPRADRTHDHEHQTGMLDHVPFVSTHSSRPPPLIDGDLLPCSADARAGRGDRERSPPRRRDHLVADRSSSPSPSTAMTTGKRDTAGSRRTVVVGLPHRGVRSRRRSARASYDAVADT